MRSVHIIVFSFNRAMQCESVLRSIIENVKGCKIVISVLWHANPEHEVGYCMLKEMYRDKNVNFYERGKTRSSFLKDISPRLGRLRNLYHWLKYSRVRAMDDFQPLLENLLEEVETDLVSFNTDDNIYFREMILSEQIFDIILNNPFDASFRTYVGRNQSDCPPVNEVGGLLYWNYYDNKMYRHWAYPFSVDGTFYERKELLAFLKKLLYHNPVTLEAFGVSFARKMRIFKNGYSPENSCMVAIPLNKVDNLVQENRHGELTVGMLNDLFVNGYRLFYDLPENVNVSGFIPEYVYAIRDQEIKKVYVS